ncbi:MAG TPA: Uma2 family endonuclease [Thermoanaerobaculia bacterium]|jgi:Uma2 family endonuclease|nr:Uma2 family endonuclease [Thermoanaerobaculia bacterium]
MSPSAATALAHPPFELVLDDGEPLESDWHTVEFPLLRQLIRQAMAEQDRTDFFVGANIFVYYSLDQAWEVSEEEKKGLQKRAFRGPDVFWVGGVTADRDRQAWIAWEEDGRLPDVIVELLSPSTAHKDRNEKRDLYAQVFRTAEYFLHDPDTQRLEGLRLAGDAYRPIRPAGNGRLWSEKLGVYLGLWQGEVEGRTNTWVRLFHPDGSLVLTAEEAQSERAEAAEKRAEEAEAENARLRALLKEAPPQA